MIKQHDLGLFALYTGADFLGLAAAYKILGVGAAAGTGEGGDRTPGGGQSKFVQLRQFVTLVTHRMPRAATVEIQVHQDYPFPALGALKQSSTPVHGEQHSV